MNQAGAILAARIKSELKELSEIVDRAEQGWERAKRTNDDFYLDGVAFIYADVEKELNEFAAFLEAAQ